MPTLDTSNFNIVVSVLGGWISLYGLISYLCKENFYLSEACEWHEITLAAKLTWHPSNISAGWRGIFTTGCQFHTPSRICRFPGKSQFYDSVLFSLSLGRPSLSLQAFSCLVGT